MAKNKTTNRATGEETPLIPDKWVLGTGLTTDGLYIVHTESPLLILKYPVSLELDEKQPCTVYLSGKIDPKTMDRLFKEAWQIVEGYRDNLVRMRSEARLFLSTMN